MSKPRDRCMIVLATVSVTGCAAPHVQRPDWTRFGNYSTPASGAPFYRNSHHQYYDTATAKYYYYDPIKKQYFWENGEPKT